MRLENEVEKLPEACSVFVGGWRWAGLGWVENDAKRRDTFGLLLESWGHWEVDESGGGWWWWSWPRRFAFTTPFANLADFRDDRFFVGAFG